MNDDEFDEMVKQAQKALSFIGTGALRSPVIIREGSRSYTRYLPQAGKVTTEPGKQERRHTYPAPCLPCGWIWVLGTCAIIQEVANVAYATGWSDSDFGEDPVFPCVYDIVK